MGTIRDNDWLSAHLHDRRIKITDCVREHGEGVADGRGNHLATFDTGSPPRRNRPPNRRVWPLLVGLPEPTRGVCERSPKEHLARSSASSARELLANEPTNQTDKPSPDLESEEASRIARPL